jgi:hypothetical protein
MLITDKVTVLHVSTLNRMQLQDYLAELLAERGHWLAEKNIDRVEVDRGFNRHMMKEMVAKQSLVAFLDRRQPSLQKEDDSMLSAVTSGLSSLLGWK